MKVFVTGATGLLGSNLIQELKVSGHQIKALVRSIEKGQRALGSDVELVQGNMQAVNDFAFELNGQDALIHAAACYTEYYQRGNKGDPLNDINVHGTISLLEAADRHGIRNVVYISSAGVYELENSQPIDEKASYGIGTNDPYFRSKIDAEIQVDRFLQSHPQMRVVLIQPSVMLGPGDTGPTPTGKFVVNFLKGNLKFLLPGSMCLVDARDAARAVVESIQKGKKGERYIIGGRKYSFEKIVNTLADISGRPVPSKRPALMLLLTVARIMGLFSKITGKPPALRSSVLKRLSRDFEYDSTKAAESLGLHLRPLDDTLSDTAAWFQKNGYI